MCHLLGLAIRVPCTTYVGVYVQPEDPSGWGRAERNAVLLWQRHGVADAVYVILCFLFFASRAGSPQRPPRLRLGLRSMHTV